MLRAFLVMMFVLCALCGLYLLVFAPEFFMPERGNPALGRQFGPLAARTLGAALAAIAVLAAIFLRHQYAETRRHPSPKVQKIYFALILLALGLLNLSLNLAEPVPAPPAQSVPEALAP
jgi:membrane associated rhomboid family serine protease